MQNLRTDGMVWVRNGEIFCRNGRRHYALLTPCNGLTLTINGQTVKDTTIVAEDDMIYCELHHEFKEIKMAMTVSEDKMQVLLEIIPGYSISRQLKDQPQSRELTLEVIETKTIRAFVSEDIVYQKLRDMDVEIGIRHDEIKRACASLEPVVCVVAEGIDPIQGRDGRFEFVIESERTEQDVYIVSDTVDWKERLNLPTVQQGEVIGFALPARPGVNGINVFGEEVPASQIKELTIDTGEGAVVHGDDRSVVATSAGRVHVTQRPNNTLKFSVIPQHVHHGNVGIKTGHIRFHGDLFILGNVEEGMWVEAGGNLTILGGVSNATIRTGGDTVIHGAVIGSSIICGYSNLIRENVLHHFKALHESLDPFIRAMRQLESNRAPFRNNAGNMNFQSMLRLLTETKFPDLPLQVRKIAAIAKNEKDSFGRDVQVMVDFLEKAVLYFHPQVSGLHQLESLAEHLGSVIMAAELDAKKKINLSIQSLTNSKVVSVWNVEVERFCYGSEIQAKGDVSVKEQVRVGRIEAGRLMRAKEIGTSSGSSTKVWVTQSDGQIKAKRIWPDTVIRIGNQTKKLLFEESDAQVKMTGNGLQIR